jgi:hypothetical protein
VSDGEKVLAGEIPANQEVSVVRWFIQHAIALGVLLLNGGDDLENHLTPDTRAALEDVDPHGPDGWLAHMRKLLRSTGDTADLA